ncbi:MAG: rhomboid family intramembrane serine protease, partial [Verrucomicrobiales bacterium]|nr:rhomboid family intramembrane serine protease [Verrucomicrobiales bacterium]
AFTNAGKIQPQAIRSGGEWWRLLTGTLMHGAIWHIAMNGLGFFYIGKFIHRLTSPVLVIIVFVISALAGAFASTLFSSDLGSVGASGGVVGMIGFLAWLVVVRWKALPYDFRSFTIRNILLLSILGAIGFFFVDNAGHAGGFLGGIFCGIIYDIFHKNRWDVPDSPMKIALGVLCSALFLFGFACCMDLFFFGGQRLVSHLPHPSW